MAQRAWREASRKKVEELKPYGVFADLLDTSALIALEPHVGEAAIGGAHYPEPLTTTPDPQGLAQSYAALFLERGADGWKKATRRASSRPPPAGWSRPRGDASPRATS